MSSERRRNWLIVFDLDGTLIDSRRDLADATNATIEELGGTPLPFDALTSMVGEGAAVLVRRALTASGLNPDTPEALPRFLAHYEQRLTVQTRPYPGIPEALRGLSRDGHTLAVLTNKPQRHTLAILDLLELAPELSHVVGGDTPAGRKPAPEGLRQIMAGAGATAESTVLVGDSPIDLETARRAGTRVCLVRYGFGYRFDEGGFRGDELFVDRPSHLVEMMAGLSQEITSAGDERTGG